MNFAISISFDVKAPPLAAFDSLASSATKLDQAMQASAGNFDKFGQTVSQLESPLSSVGGSMGELEGSMSGLEGSLGSAASGMGELAGSTEQLNSSIGETGGFVTDAAGGMGELASGASESGSSMTELGGATGEFNGVISETGGFVQETGTSMGELSTATGETGTAFGELNPQVTETNTGLTETNTTLGETVPAMEETATGAEAVGTGFEAAVPPIEDVNTAAGESIPIFEGAGTAASDAGVSTENYTGALGGLGQELGPVVGGLTEENTVMGNLALTTGDTTTASEGLTGSFGQLGFGITALTGGAMSLFGAFTSIRDAQLRVEIANNRLDKANTKVDTSMMKLNNTINNLLNDTSLQVQGLGALATAQDNYNKLVEAGITSGPQYEAALAALRAAQQGLTSSTSEGTQAINGLSPIIDKATQSIDAQHIATVKAQKSNEGLVGAFVQLSGGITTIVGVLGGLSQTLTSGGAALGIFKGHWIDLGIKMFGTAGAISTISGALAALAVPIGIAVLAIGAFVAAITAIRVHIKVFDDLGAAIGHVFPQAVGFLNEFRAAFISTSDAVNSSISFILGGIDALSGGTVKSQSAWDAWVQSTFHASESAGKLGGDIKVLDTGVAGTNASLVMAKGTFQEFNGNLKDMDNNMIALAGGWFKNEQGAAVVTQRFGEASAATNVSAQSQAELNSILGPYVPLAQGAGEATAEQGAATADSASKNTLLGKALSGNIPALTAIIQGETEAAMSAGEMALGTDEATTATEGITPAAAGAGGAVLSLSEQLTLAAQSTDPLIAGIAQTIISLRDEEQAAQKTHAGNQLLLSLWGVEMPAAIANDREAIQALVNIHAEENAAVDKTLVSANEMILKYGDMTRATSMTREEKIAYAQVLEDTVKKQEEEKAALEDTISVQEQVAAKVEELTKKKKEEGIETEATRQFLVRYIQEQHNVVVAVDESIQVLEALEKGLAAVSTAYEDGRASTVSWYMELKASAEEARGARDQLEQFATQVLHGSDVLQQSTETLKMWLGVFEGAPESIDALTQALDDAWASIGKGVEEVDKLRQGFLDAGEGIKGSIDDTFEDVQSSFDELNETLAEGGEDARNFKDTFKESMQDLADDTDMSIGEIERILGEDLVAALNNPEISDLEFAHMWMQQSGQVQENLKDLTGSYQDFTTDTVSVLREFAPKIGEILAEGVEAGKNPVNELSALFKQLPTSVQEDLAGVTAAMRTAGDDWSASVINAMSVMKAGMSEAEWATVFNPMIAKFQEMAAAGDIEAQKVVDAVTKMGLGVGTGVDTATSKIGEIGPAADLARQNWAAQMDIMLQILQLWTDATQTMATVVSTAYSNMANNTGHSLVIMGQGLTLMQGIITNFISFVQSGAITVSGAFNNMANNVNTSLVTAARGLTTFQGILTNFIRATQSGATTVSGAFNNMATNINTSTTRAKTSITTLQSAITTLASTGASKASSFASSFSSAMSKVQSSAKNAESAVRNLQSAINSLKSKTITLTTIRRTVYQTAYAARGGAFVASSPTKVGPLKVSEFGQQELVTVTPLQNPSGQTITGPGMQVSTSGPGAKAFAKSGDKSISLGGPMNGGGNTLTDAEVRSLIKKISEGIETQTKKISGNKVKTIIMKESPIVFNLNEKVLINAVNRRIFELSDSIIS